MKAQLIALFQMGAWGDVEKPRWDMVFLLVVPSIAVGCEWVFGIVVVWAHPNQAHFKTLEEAAHRLVLLVDISKHRLAVCLHVVEQCHVLCSPNK